MSSSWLLELAVTSAEIDTARPTVLAINVLATCTRFLEPLTPHAQTLSRLLDSLAEPGPAAPHLPLTQALLQALHATPQHWIAPN